MNISIPFDMDQDQFIENFNQAVAAGKLLVFRIVISPEQLAARIEANREKDAAVDQLQAFAKRYLNSSGAGAPSTSPSARPNERMVSPALIEALRDATRAVDLTNAQQPADFGPLVEALKKMPAPVVNVTVTPEISLQPAREVITMDRNQAGQITRAEKRIMPAAPAGLE